MKLPRPALFLWHFIFAGFFLGTLTLMGPVRWVTGYMRGAGKGEGAERLAVIAIILALAAAAALLARFLALRPPGAGRRRYALPALSLALFLSALALWMNPRLMAGTARGSAEAFSSSQFVFGPYPEADRISSLKAEHYDGVISLLSEAVAPFEPVLLARERKAAEAAGLPLIHIPMLPWVSANDHVKARLEELKAGGPGKYYVHCYLGKDRVNVFRRMLAGVYGEAAAGTPAAGARRLAAGLMFERGPVRQLDKDVFLCPYPTDEEFFGYILNGNCATLVSLLDPANPENGAWIAKEKDIAAKHGLKLVSYPWLALDKAGKEKAVREIRALKHPVVAHAFLSKAQECADFESFYSAASGR